MAVVSFQGEDGWFVSGWTFRRLCEDVRNRFALDHDLSYKLEQSQALSGLHFALMKPDMRNKLLRMLKEAISEIINDDSKEFQGSLDAEGYNMYKAKLPELLGYIKKYENAEWPSDQN